MEESSNLLAALEAMLKMKSVVIEPSTTLETTPSTSSARKRPHESDHVLEAKKPRVEPSVRQSVGNTFSTIDIPVGTSRDLSVFMEQAKEDICGVIEDELNNRKALKFYLTVNLELERTSVDGGVTTTTPYLHSLPCVVLESSDLEEQFQTASQRIKFLLETFEGEGSGFSLRSIKECTVNVATFDVIGGSSFIELPAYIQNKKATVNVKNADEFFFILFVVREEPAQYQ